MNSFYKFQFGTELIGVISCVIFSGAAVELQYMDLTFISSQITGSVSPKVGLILSIILVSLVFYESSSVYQSSKNTSKQKSPTESTDLNKDRLERSTGQRDEMLEDNKEKVKEE